MWGESDLPQFNALFGVSFLVFLNILSVPAAIEAITGELLFKDSNASHIGVLVLWLIVLGASYFLLVYNEVYKRIAKEFKNERAPQRRNRLIAIFVYVLFTFLTSFGFVAMRRGFN